MKKRPHKTLGCRKISSKKEVYNTKILPQETKKKSQLNNLTLYLKKLEKEQKKKTKLTEGKKS